MGIKLQLLAIIKIKIRIQFIWKLANEQILLG